MYRHVLAGLSDEFRVISVDAPGHGKTLEPVGGPFRSISDHADFNEALISALGLEQSGDRRLLHGRQHGCSNSLPGARTSTGP